MYEILGLEFQDKVKMSPQEIAHNKKGKDEFSKVNISDTVVPESKLPPKFLSTHIEFESGIKQLKHAQFFLRHLL